MIELNTIKTTIIDGEEVYVVNAREIHQELQTCQNFEDWFFDYDTESLYLEGGILLTLVRDTSGNLDMEIHLTLERAKFFCEEECSQRGALISTYLYQYPIRAQLMESKRKLEESMNDLFDSLYASVLVMSREYEDYFDEEVLREKSSMMNLEPLDFYNEETGKIEMHWHKNVWMEAYGVVHCDDYQEVL